MYLIVKALARTSSAIVSTAAGRRAPTTSSAATRPIDQDLFKTINRRALRFSFFSSLPAYLFGRYIVAARLGAAADPVQRYRSIPAVMLVFCGFPLTW